MSDKQYVIFIYTNLFFIFNFVWHCLTYAGRGVKNNSGSSE